MNTITIGKYTFTDTDIQRGNIIMEHSAIGETLSADALTFEVQCEDTGNAALFTKFLEWYHTVNNQGFVIAGDNIEDLAYATPAFYYIDGALQSKFFLTSIERIGKTIYRLNCLSAVGLLITAKHYGGIYNGITAATLIAEILDGLSYTLDASLSTSVIRGYLQIGRAHV